LGGNALSGIFVFVITGTGAGGLLLGVGGNALSGIFVFVITARAALRGNRWPGYSRGNALSGIFVFVIRPIPNQVGGRGLW